MSSQKASSDKIEKECFLSSKVSPSAGPYEHFNFEQQMQRHPMSFHNEPRPQFPGLISKESLFAKDFAKKVDPESMNKKPEISNRYFEAQNKKH